MMDHDAPGSSHSDFIPAYYIWEGGARDNHEKVNTMDPAGQNIMFYDGRVEWVDFKGTKFRESKYRGRAHSYWHFVYW